MGAGLALRRLVGFDGLMSLPGLIWNDVVIYNKICTPTKIYCRHHDLAEAKRLQS